MKKREISAGAEKVENIARRGSLQGEAANNGASGAEQEREAAERWHHFFVPCARCQPPSGRAHPSPETLRARGILVMPPGYPGGPTAFDRDHALGVLWPHAGN